LAPQARLIAAEAIEHAARQIGEAQEAARDFGCGVEIVVLEASVV
jgi:hypothetical protein